MRNRKKLGGLISLFLISSIQVQCMDKKAINKMVTKVVNHPYLVIGTAVIVGIALKVGHDRYKRRKYKPWEFFGIETKNEKGGQWGYVLTAVAFAVGCYLVAYLYGKNPRQLQLKFMNIMGYKSTETLYRKSQTNSTLYNQFQRLDTKYNFDDSDNCV